MAVAKWATPGTRSSNIAGTTLNTLAHLGESATMSYDNSGTNDKNLYGAVTVKLGAINASAGASITLRVQFIETDTPDGRAGGDLYTSTVFRDGTSAAKIVIFNMVRLYPFSMRLAIINNTGVTFAASGNELYVKPWNEDVS